MTDEIVFAVCDDEAYIRESVKQNIKHLYTGATVLEFDSGEALTSFDGQLDVIFLDIQMKGLSGMDAAKRLREDGNNAAIIFVTGMEEYVYEAFDVGAFHYLVKPFDKVKFYEVLQKAVADRETLIKSRAEEEPSITVKTGGFTRKIFLCDIIYFEVYGRKVLLHTTHEDIEFYGKLSEIEARLPRSFFRCHRSYIVNLKYLLKYTGTSIVLDDGSRILLAKQRHGELVSRYMEYIDS